MSVFSFVRGLGVQMAVLRVLGLVSVMKLEPEHGSLLGLTSDSARTEVLQGVGGGRLIPHSLTLKLYLGTICLWQPGRGVVPGHRALIV